MSISFLDSHAHLTSDFDLGEIDDLLARAKKAGVTRVVNICVDEKSFKKGVALRKKNPDVSLVAAIPPQDIVKGERLDFFEEAMAAKLLAAIGETGLDYHYGFAFREEQKRVLHFYLKMAIDFDLPLVVHCREAFCDLFEITSLYSKKDIVLHCFTGDREIAKEAVLRDWFISFSGIVTFKNSNTIREAVKEVPLENLLIETDAPYLAPQNHRGRRNEPMFLPEIAAFVADIKGITVEEVAQATFENGNKLFF